jgi:hypothetical protein
MLATVIKQPADHLDYDVDFGRWLPSGDAVTMAETAVEPTGQLVIDSVQITGAIVKVWTSGGLTGESYKITVTASTSGGRIKQAEFRVRVRDN